MTAHELPTRAEPLRSATPPAAGAEPSAAAPPWRALSALLIGTFITSIDFFIVNVALPAMQTELQASSGSIEWIVAAYSLGVAATLLTAGRLGDRLGRRTAFVAGIAVFAAASLVCAAAPTAGVLVAGRFAQGVATAFVTTSTLATIGALFRGAARARAVGLYAAVLGIGAAAGQIIGGVLVSLDVLGLGWRSIFAINVPVGAVALVLTPFVVPATRGARRRLDGWGTLLMALAVIALVLPLIEGRDADWAPWVWACLGAVPVLVAGFLVQQRRLERSGGEPMFPRLLLRTPSFRDGLLWQLVYWCGQSSFYVVLTLFLQLGRGLSALESGLIFLGLALPYLLAVRLAPRLAAHAGRGALGWGALCNLAGLAALAAVALSGAGIGWLLVGFALCGVAQGVSIPLSTSVVLATAAPHEAGIVSGALSTMQQLGGSLGVAIVGTVFFGAAGGAGIPGAYAASLVPLAVIALATLSLTFRLPRGEAR